MQDTPYPDVNRLLDSLLSRMQHILGEKLVGLYLYGSLATGDFDHDVSDIDLLAATSSDVSDAEIEDLREMHAALARNNKAWDNRLDVDYMSLSALRTFRSHTSLKPGISPGEPFLAKEVGEDWLINWYMVRERGVALFGPPPKTIIDPITKEEFAQAIREHAAAWGGGIETRPTSKEQAYAILTMCRALYSHKNGEQVSKKRAAFWVQHELPEWSRLIQRALEWREAWREERVDHSATHA